MLSTNIIAKENSYEFSREDCGLLFVVADPLIATKLSEDYFANFHLKPFNALKKAVEISMCPNIVAMGYFEGVSYFSSFGDTQVKINRNNLTSDILLEKQALQSASGYPKEGDVISLRGQTGKMIIKFESKKKLSFSFPIKFDKKIYLRPQTNEEVSPQSKRMTYFIALGLIGILIVAVILGVAKKRSNDLKLKYVGILTSSSENLNQAISLSSSDPEKSREYFIMSEKGLKEIEELNVNDQEIYALKNKIDTSRQSILGEYNEPFELFLDLGLLSSGFKGDALSVTDGKVFVLDKNGKKVVSVEMGTKKSKVVAGPSVISDGLDLATYENTVYILEQDGVYESGNSKKKVIDKTWSGEVFIKVFGGNMYILDKSGNQIYRHSGTSTGFSEKQNWLSSTTSVNFNDAKSWGLDGSIYVLYPNSKVLKYSQGSPQSFKISGVIPEIGNVDYLYADPNNTYLYLLDKAGKRVVVVDKKGGYKAQYFDDKIAESTSIAVSEIDKKIILLTGEKLLQIEIKN